MTTGHQVKYDLVSNSSKKIFFLGGGALEIPHSVSEATTTTNHPSFSKPQKNISEAIWNQLSHIFSVGEQRYSVLSFCGRTARLQESLWRSSNTEQYLWKSHRAKHGIQRWVFTIQILQLFLGGLEWPEWFAAEKVCFGHAEADEESFTDNPEDYIRRDMEGSDVDTRRRAACDLVRALSKLFEGPVISNFSQYVQAMLVVSRSVASPRIQPNLFVSFGVIDLKVEHFAGLCRNIRTTPHNTGRIRMRQFTSWHP